eukprot:4573829-Prymnesium_polylepis.1
MAAARQSQSESVESAGTPTDIILTPRASVPSAGTLDEPAPPKADVAKRKEEAAAPDGSQPLAEVLTEWAIEGAKVRPSRARQWPRRRKRVDAGGL